MSLKSLFFRSKVVSLPTDAKSAVMDAETRRVHFRTALENAHKDIVMASARLELIGTAPAVDDAERWDRARAAVKILQRAA